VKPSHLLVALASALATGRDARAQGEKSSVATLYILINYDSQKMTPEF